MSLSTFTTLLLFAAVANAGGDVAIIGCGPSGLLQAYELIEAGMDGNKIDIFEMGPKCARLVTTLEHQLGVGGTTDYVDVGTSVVTAHWYTKAQVGIPSFDEQAQSGTQELGKKLLERAGNLVDDMDPAVIERAVRILTAAGQGGNIGGGSGSGGNDIGGSNLDATPTATPFDPSNPLGYTDIGQIGAPYGEILQEIGIEMIPLNTRSISWDPLTKNFAFPPFPANVDFFDPAVVGQLIQESIVGIHILESVLVHTRGLQGVYLAGFCQAGETFEQWIARNNLPVFGEFAAAQMDINTNASPAKIQPCTVILKAAAFILVDLVRDFFHRVGVFQTGDPFTDYVLSQTDDFQYYIPEGGYQAIIDALAVDLVAKDVTIRLNSKVTGLQFDGDDEVEVTYLDVEQNKVRDRDYDVVINAVRPEESNFFQNYPAVDALYALARDNRDFGNLASLAFSVTNATAAGLPPFPDPFNPTQIADPVAFVPFPVYLDFGTATFDVPNCVPWVFLKDRAGVPVYTLYSYRDPDTPEEVCLQMMRDYAASVNVWIENEIGNTVHNWPSIVSPTQEGAGWYDLMDAQQGVGNLFLTGDILSGGGVPLISDYMRATRDEMVGGLTALGIDFSSSSSSSSP